MKTLREYIDQLDEISRRDFIKGVGATAGAAALGTTSKNAIASSYQLTKEDFAAIAMANYIISYIRMTSGNKGVASMLKSSLQEVSGFMGGYPVEKDETQTVQELLQTNPESRRTFFDLYSTPDGAIKIANRIGSLRDKLVKGMSPEEQRHHINRLGIR